MTKVRNSRGMASDRAFLGRTAIHLLTIALLISPASCGKKSGSSSNKKPETPSDPQVTDAPVKSDSDGVVVAAVDTTASTRLRASAGSGIAGTEVLFPAGSLGVALDVTIGEGPTFDVVSAQSELGIDSSVTITPTTGTLVITASQVIDPLKPISVTMPLKTSAGLVPAGFKYAVLSQVVRTSTAGTANSTVVMINANAGVTESEGKVTFPIHFFGAHSVVTVPETFTEVKEVPSARPLPEPQKPSPEPAEQSLALATSVPANNTTVARPSSIELTFTQPIDQNTVNGAIQLKQADANVAASISVDGARVVINPEVSLALGLAYKVAIGSGIKSTAGKTPDQAQEIAFTVADGAWGSLETSSRFVDGSFTSTQLARLNQGRFGFVGPYGSQKALAFVFDGTSWGNPIELTLSENAAALQAVGGNDGRLYVSYILQSSMVFYGMRFNPALSAPFDVGGLTSQLAIGDDDARSNTFSKPRIAILGSGKALYLAKRNDNAFVARVLDGDLFSSQELVVAAGGDSVYEWDLTSNEAGEAALIFYRQVSANYQLNVLKRSVSGSWTNLTPTGTELSQSASAYLDVGIDNAGKVVALWCESTECKGATHNGSSWSTPHTLPYAGTTTNGRFAFDPRSGVAMKTWKVNNLRGRSANYELLSATFAAGQWSNPIVFDSSAVGIDPAPIAFDGVGRVRAIWLKEGVIKSARYASGAWGTIQDAYSGTLGGQPMFNCDPSGECIFVWSESVTSPSNKVLKYVRFK